MHKTSVIIPTYNSGKTLRRAVISVLTQEGVGNFNIELLICDDCSTDNTIEIAKDFLYYNKYNCYQIKIFQNRINSGGPNWGRNKGIEHATGNLLAFLDSDDAWVKDKLATQIKEIDNGAEFVYSHNLKGV